MKFEILVVDDDETWARTFCDNLKTIPPADLAGPGFDDFAIQILTNQLDADRIISLPSAPQFHLILLDLNYPKTTGGPVRLDPSEPLQGMLWLPELRRLQPKATIVILTAWAMERDLLSAVAAIRDYHANDFVPKTAPFRDIASRVSLALQNARQRQRMLVLLKQWAVAQSKAAMVYTLDIADILRNLRQLMDRTAQRIESGDSSAIAAAPDAIRGEFRSAIGELEHLTRVIDVRLNPGGRRTQCIDLADLARDLTLFYDAWLESAKAKAAEVAASPKCSVTTFVGELQMALHEVIGNAIESLADSRRPGRERLLAITVGADNGGAVIQIEDNGDGFSDEALANLFKLGKTTHDPRQHVGVGLYVARRAMYALGGEIRAENRPEGGARVRLFIPNLK